VVPAAVERRHRETIDEDGSMSGLDLLLELQALDTQLDQLRHRRATLPQRAALEALAQRRAATIAGVADERAERDALARDQKRLEDEVATVEDKAASVDRQLYGGHITSPKEAQALQADVESLKRRQRDLEDQELEIMERLEPLDARLGEADAALAAIDAEREATQSELHTAEGELDGEIASAEGKRDGAAGSVDATLLATYEQLRASLGGVAVARLDHGTCQGCHLTLSPGEVDRIRREPPDVVAHCPECQRILVR
jgi:predicted  nucleic acid-binding Zn-ribbon protein